MRAIIERRTIWLSIVGIVALCAGSWAAHAWYSSSRATEPPAFLLATLPATVRDFALQDAAGRSRSLANFRGKVIVMFFGFTRCPDVCPTELFKLSQVMNLLGEDAERVQVLFVTLDPERDTPALMETYTAAFDQRFIGLTGTRTDIDRVAADYYVAHAKAGPAENYVIDHSTSTYLIDPAGQLRLLGKMDTPIETFAHDIRLLLHEDR